MILIDVKNLYKEYKVLVRKNGFKGVLSSIFNRKYKIVKAVNNISFKINKGDIVGYIGPNGAGKSTTIKMLTGILVPSSGSISVSGIEPYVNRKLNAKRMGAIFGQRTNLWWDLPVEDSFILCKYIYEIPEKIYQENIELFSSLLGIDELLNIPVRQLSLGQRMRADFCAALLHNPEIVYFDEPTIGLDLLAKEKIRDFILNVNRQKKTTIIITTHDMSDIEKLCKRVIMINKGIICYDGSIELMKNKYAAIEVLTVTFHTITKSASDPLVTYSFFKKQVEIIQESDEELKLYYDPKNISLSDILIEINRYRKIVSVNVEKKNIDDIVKKLYIESNEKTEIHK